MVWQEALDVSLNGEMRTCIVGAETQMKLNFLFGVCLESLILRLRHSDNLNKTLQHKTLSAAESQRITKLTVNVLQKIRSNELFAAYYQRVIQKQTRFGVADSCISRKWRVPQHFEVGSSNGDFYVTPRLNTARYTMGQLIMLLRPSMTDSTSLAIAHIGILRSLW